MQPTPPTEATPSSTPKFVISAVNGTVLYVLAYLLINGLQQLATVLMAMQLRVPGSWNLSTINYSLTNGQWWRVAVVAIYGVGPLVAAVAGLAAYQWYWRRQRARRGLLKLLLIWLALHACNAVFGALASDTVLHAGFYYVPAWLFQLGNIVNGALAVLAGLAQVVIGYYASVAFLQAHDSRTVMEYPNRRRMVFSTIVVPWLAGSLLLVLAKAPALSLLEGLHFGAMALLLGPMALGCLNELFSSTVRSPLQTRVAWGLLGVLGLLLLGWRLLLSPPILFGV